MYKISGKLRQSKLSEKEVKRNVKQGHFRKSNILQQIKQKSRKKNAKKYPNGKKCPDFKAPSPRKCPVQQIKMNYRKAYNIVPLSSRGNKTGHYKGWAI